MTSLDRALQPRDLSSYSDKTTNAMTVAPIQPIVPVRRVPVSPNANAQANRLIANSQNQAEYAVKKLLTKPRSLTPTGTLTTPVVVNSSPFSFDLLSGPRPIGTKSYSKGEYITLPANGTLTVANIDGSGYVDSMWFGIPITSNITITTDGETAYSGPSAHFFSAVYADSQPAVSSKWFMFNSAAAGGGGVGLASALAIPFGSNVTIQITETTGSSKTIFWEIGFQLNIALSTFGSTQKFRAVSGTANPAAYSTVTLANITNSTPGRFAGLYFNYDAFPGSVSPATAPLEGDVTISNENGIAYQSSGTEDYLFMSDFFNGFAQNSSGMDCALTVKTSVTWAGYRIHQSDPIGFNSALNVTWTAGESSHATYTGTPRFFWCVWYYTQ